MPVVCPFASNRPPCGRKKLDSQHVLQKTWILPSLKLKVMPSTGHHNTQRVALALSPSRHYAFVRVRSGHMNAFQIVGCPAGVHAALAGRPSP
jgi:hypothetical protein